MRSMSRPPRKPAKRPTSTSESRRTNVLLEEIRATLSVIAEDQRGLRSEFGTFKAALLETSERVKRLEPMARTLAPVPDELKSLADVVRKLGKDMELVTFSSSRSNQELEAVKTELRLLRSDLRALEKRLSGAESKLAP